MTFIAVPDRSRLIYNLGEVEKPASPGRRLRPVTTRGRRDICAGMETNSASISENVLFRTVYQGGGPW